MQASEDIQLLQEYAKNGSETAFASLVERHINKVYSVAFRQTCNPHSAEEITQAVFVILAKKAASLKSGVILEGWLYQTARLTATTFIRGEIRRSRREQEAYMQSEPIANESETWAHIAPLLDDALAGLNATDRDAVVLRFFYDQSMGDIGAAMGATEDTARKRVNRALDKLQKYFFKRGVRSTTDTISDTISAHSIQPAPVALAKITIAVALAKGATASVSTTTLIQGALKLMTWTKVKTAIVISLGAILMAGTATVIIKPIFFPLIKDVYFEPNYRHFQNLPRGLEALRPSHFQTPLDGLSYSAETTGKAGEHVTLMMDRNVSFQQLVTHAYSAPGAFVVWPANAPTGRFDYLSTILDDKTGERFQQAIKKRFGYVAAWKDNVSTEVLLLKMQASGAPGLKASSRAAPSRISKRSDGAFQFQNWPLSGLAYFLEGQAKVPVIDHTDDADHFDFVFDCAAEDLAGHNWDEVNRALDKLGLTVVTTNMPLRMLVVEEVK